MAEIIDAQAVSEPGALTDRLEEGDLILFTDRAFEVAPEESHLISPDKMPVTTPLPVAWAASRSKTRTSSDYQA